MRMRRTAVLVAAVLLVAATAIAKQFMSDRNAAPSLCMSMKISPREPSSYSPVRRKTLWPPTRASCVNPRRFVERRTREPTGRTAAAGVRRASGLASTVSSSGGTLSPLDVERGWDALQPSR